MSKRGLVAYSDALRLEYGDEISVTTVYPGYIRTPIHDAAALEGISLEGAVPAEALADAADTLVRATLGPPARDLATTRRGPRVTHCCGSPLESWSIGSSAGVCKPRHCAATSTDPSSPPGCANAWAASS